MNKGKRSIQSQATYWLGVTIIGLTVGLGIQFTQAWVDPSGSAPAGNVSGPITTGIANQVKTGGLGLGSLSVTGSAAVGGKITSASTVSSDSGTTVVTKDYVDGKTGFVSVSSTSGSCSGPCGPSTTAACPSGKKVLTGSCTTFGAGPANVSIYADQANGTAGWLCAEWNGSASSGGIIATAVCY